MSATSLILLLTLPFLLLLTACPAETQKTVSTPGNTQADTVIDDHSGHDHGAPDPSMVVLPQELKDAMTDSGSYNVDLTKTGYWVEYRVLIREGEAGGVADTVFSRDQGRYNRDKKTGTWRFSLSQDKTLPQKWELIEQIDFLDDELHGAKKMFKNGRLYYVEHYKKGKQDSLSFYFDDFGILKLEAGYRQGKKHGTIKEYDAAGKIKSVVTFEDGIQKGYYAHYYPGGTLKEEGSSEAGNATGTWKLYHPNGQLWTERVYRDGKPWEVISNFTKDGVKRPAGTLKDGSGTMILYDDAGLAAETEVYRNGEKIN